MSRKTEMGRGEVRVRTVEIEGRSLIELEFWPPEAPPVGLRMPPESALRIAHDLAKALAILGLVEAVPPLEEP